MACLILLGIATAIMIGLGLEEEIRFGNNLSAVSQRAARLGGGVSNGRRTYRRHVGIWFHGLHITNEEMPEIAAIVRECQTRGLGDTNLSLSLSRTGVDDEGIKLLHQLSGLDSVSLDDTKVTKDGIRSLQKARPSTAVFPRPIP